MMSGRPENGMNFVRAIRASCYEVGETQRRCDMSTTVSMTACFADATKIPV